MGSLKRRCSLRSRSGRQSCWAAWTYKKHSACPYSW